MPDKRRHRGPHPDDALLFAVSAIPDLRAATCDMSLLLSRGYAPTSVLKLVGDRFALAARQRVAVARCACSDDSRAGRRSRRLAPSRMKGRELWIDGYNLLTTVEAALSGGVILVGRDGCYRDMASMHGSYRKVAETGPALKRIGALLAEWRVARCRWLLDRPVSNSGRLKAVLQDVAIAAGWNWEIELVQNPDAELIATAEVVASADSMILDGCSRWVNLARAVVADIPDAWVVDLAAG